MKDWGTPDARAIRRVSPQTLAELSFAPGSMGPKIAAAREFVEQTGGVTGIGKLDDAPAIVDGAAGTVIAGDATKTLWWD